MTKICLTIAVLFLLPSACARYIPPEGFYALTEVETPPIQISCSAHRPPDEPRINFSEWGFVRMSITAAGKPANISAYRPHFIRENDNNAQQLSENDAAAMAVAASCIYEPARQSGLPVPVHGVEERFYVGRR